MPVSEYIRTIRKSIGSQYLLIPGVSVLPRDDKGQILLVYPFDFGCWAVLGGGVDPDEHPADAARREVREELGVDSELLGLRGVAGGPGYRVRYPNGDLIGYVTSIFDARLLGDPVADNDEIQRFGWFNPDAIGELEIVDSSRQILRDAGILPT